MPQPDNGPTTDDADRSVPLVRFSKALLDPEQPKPAGIVGPHGKKAVKRFNVYRNNVTVGLINALADIYPAVHRIVGDRFFRSMAKAYIRTEQPSSPLLFRYGSGFPAFMETFEPVRELVYLPDVARLERAWLDAFHAADRPVLGADELAAVAPQDLAQQSFAPHPAARVLRSPYAAVSVFSANRAGEDPSGIKTGIAEDGLVTRRAFDVEVRHLPPGGAVFLQLLMNGDTLGEAAGATAAESEDFDLAAAIAAMLEAGVFSGLATDRKTEESISNDIAD